LNRYNSVQLAAITIDSKQGARWRLTDEEDNEICEQVLQPFTFLRHLADVRVNGVSDHYAGCVECQMESHGPAENIWRMKAVFPGLVQPLDWG
jgi:hypothetical protein